MLLKILKCENIFRYDFYNLCYLNFKDFNKQNAVCACVFIKKLMKEKNDEKKRKEEE